MKAYLTHDGISDSNTYLRETFARLTDQISGGETRRYDDVTAVSAGLAFPVYNQLFAFDGAPTEAVSSALDWLRKRDVPFLVTASDGAVETIERVDQHLRRSGDPDIRMVRPGLDSVPHAAGPVDIVEVNDTDRLDEFISVYTDVFSKSRAVAARVYNSLWTADGVRLFVGRAGGDPVVTGSLETSGSVAGLYTIGVRTAFRRQGVGSAMTAALLAAGSEMGCRVGALQTAQPAVYRGQGFEPVVSYHSFEPVN